MNREYAEIVEAGLCVRCRQRDDRIMKGYVLCEECSRRQREAGARGTRIARGRKVCVLCGTQDERTMNGGRTCEKCRAYATKMDRERRWRQDGGSAVKRNERMEARKCLRME